MTDVLIIDSSTNAVAVAVGSSGADSQSSNVAQQSFHSENILVSIDALLKKRNLGMSEISAIGVGVGPGLFTGLRVGITAAHAFAQALKVPLVYFSSIELTAFSSLNDIARPTAEVLVGRDARRHELYCAKYSLARIAPTEITIDTTKISTSLKRTKSEQLLSPSGFVDLANSEPEHLLVLDDVEKYEEFEALNGMAVNGLLKAQIDASKMIDHVMDSVMAGITVDVFSPSALYIRKSDAELSWGVSQ